MFGKMKRALSERLLGLLAILFIMAGTLGNTLGEQSVPLPMGNGDVVAISDDGQVTRRSHAGNVVWSVKVTGETGGVRPPHLLADSSRAYFSQNGGVTALSVTNSATLWHSAGSARCLFLSGDLLLSAGVSGTKRWLVARHIEDGGDSFRLALPPDFEVTGITDEDGLFLVQEYISPSRILAFLVNRDGTVLHQFTNLIVTVRSWAGGRLVLTGAEVIRLTAKGEVEWSTPFERGTSMPGGGFVPVNGGQMMAYLYSPSADSGVEVLRFDPVRGDKVWEAYCPGLGVAHSIYNHSAEVKVGRPLHPDWTVVISHGDGGGFLEELDAMGRSQRRETGSK
jgi:outer membrane protein assembly factor BamB